MRESIGGLTIFQIVFIFILLFAGIMCLTINHSKAFGVKDEVINIIQEEGSAAYLSKEVLQDIADELTENGYRTTGTCPQSDGDPFIAYDRNGKETSGVAAFCIRRVDVGKASQEALKEICSTGCKFASGDDVNKAYYDLVLFYQLDIPVIKMFTSFRVFGSTKILYE